MNERIKVLAEQFNMEISPAYPEHNQKVLEKFAELIVEETLKQVDERCYTRGENQWYYDDDKRWVRLHFGYGDLAEKISKKNVV